MSDKTSANSLTRAPSDPVRWTFANPWLSEGQADDRTPMNGSVANTISSPRIRPASSPVDVQEMVADLTYSQLA